MFLKNLLLKKQKLVFFYIGDFDVYGQKIYLDYLFGKKLNVQENLALPTMKLIGINHEDTRSLKKGKIPMSVKDFMHLQKLQMKECFTLPPQSLTLTEYQKIMIANLNQVMDNLRTMKVECTK